MSQSLEKKLAYILLTECINIYLHIPLDKKKLKVQKILLEFLVNTDYIAED